MASTNAWTRGAEVGLFDGRTHLHLLERCPGLHMIGVDVWDAFPSFREGPTKSGEKCRCRWCEETRAARRAETPAQMRQRVIRQTAKYGARSVIYVEPSAAAAARVDDHSLDFVFIDGDHSVEGVTADLTAWLPKVREGGSIIGHDYNMQSVRIAVQSFFPERMISTGSDHLWMSWRDRRWMKPKA